MVKYPRFRLSSLAMFLALLCVLMAWWIDHSRQEAKLRIAINGTSYLGEYAGFTKMLNISHYPIQAQREAAVESELVFFVLSLFRNKEGVLVQFEEFNMKGTGHPIIFVAEILEILECKSTDEYFRLLRKYWSGEELDDWVSENGEFYDEFSSFVQSAIEYSEKFPTK